MDDVHSRLNTGNLVGAARASRERGWHQSAALGLIGAFDQALPGLTATDDPNARIFHALCLWIDGQDAAAEAMLAEAPSSPAATHLQRLLRKERIKALAFLPPYRTGPHSIFGSVGLDPRFDVRCVWFDANDKGISNRVGASVHDFYSHEAKPDLLICEMVEWHVLPRNLAEAPFLKVGHTSDFDIHGQEVLPWLKLFNVVLTLDDTEWSKLRRALPDRTVLNYPKVFPVKPRLTRLALDRPIDVLMTGTVYSDYHHDKNELIARLVGIPGLNCVFLNGFVSTAEYERLTQQSKLTVSYVRHSGTMPTRALESVALGTWPLIQHDSALRLYLQDDAALLPYEHGKWECLAADVLSFVSNYDERKKDYVARITETRNLASRAFAPDRVASQYLRFCAALPALSAAIDLTIPSDSRRPPRLLMKRGCVTKGWLPAGGDEAVLRSLMETNARVAQTAGDPRGFNEAGRERLIEYARLSSRNLTDAHLLEQAVEAFEHAIAKEPASLAPRFNLIRAGFHFGDSALRKRAVALAEDTLRCHDAGNLTLSADDDLLPYDFYPSHFNAQLACDLRLDVEGGNAFALDRVKALIIASIHFYLARSMGAELGANEHYQKANELDPGHQHFRIGHAEYLLATRPQEPQRAVEELTEVVTTKTWTPLLAALAGQVREDNGGEGLSSTNILFFDVEDELARDHRYRLARCHDMLGETYFGIGRFRSHSPRLALVLCGAGVSASPKVRMALSTLRERVGDVEIIIIDTAIDVRGATDVKTADVLVTAPQPGAVAYSSKAIGEAIRFVRAPYAVIVEPDTRALDFVVDQLEKLFETNEIADGTIRQGRPMIIIRDAQHRIPAREVLCVGMRVDHLRACGLPQRIGMLQDARLALPVLVHQLRPSTDSFLAIDCDAGRIDIEASASPMLDLQRFVTHAENSVLTTLSADWRRFTSERTPTDPKSHVHFAISRIEADELPSEGSLEPAKESGDATVKHRDRYQFVIEFDQASMGYRLARSLYTRVLTGRRRALFSHRLFSLDDTSALDLGFLRIEHTYPGMKVKIPILRSLALLGMPKAKV